MREDELWARLESYVRAYLPQWQYDRNGSEPEAALLTALGALLETGRARLDRLPERHELEFLRGFGLERRGRTAAQAYASFTAPRGCRVQAGSAFYLSGDGKRVWRTQGDVWAGSLRMTGQFLSGGESGKVIVLPMPGEGTTARLFDFRAPGAQQRMARFSHPDIFASARGCRVYLTLTKASPEMLAFLSDPQAVSWFLEREGSEALPLSAPAQEEGGTLSFDLPAAPSGRSLLAQAADGAAAPAQAVGAVLAGTSRGGAQEDGFPCDAILTDEGAWSEGEWLPFGEEPEPWRSCQIACADALGLRGAVVTASWSMALRERETRLPGTQQEPEYQPVMRSLPPEAPQPREVCADVTAWEYWNGSGWRSVPGTEKYAQLFAGEAGGAAERVTAVFLWPEDAAPHSLGGVEACWLRWRVRSARWAGWLPRRSRAPAVFDLRFSAVLDKAPVRVERVCGLAGEPFCPLGEDEVLFPALTGQADEWWLGFDQPPAGESMALYLSLEHGAAGAFSAWEARSGRGERPLGLADETGGLAHDGLLTLSGLAGEASVRFGRKGWWLCLRKETPGPWGGGRYPALKSLYWCVARIRAVGADACAPGDSLQPLRGGVVSGRVLTQSFGGIEEETLRESVNRARASRHYLGRAVSGLDVEQLLQGALRDVVRARCVRREDSLEVGVLLRDVHRHAAAFALRSGEIRRTLEEGSVLPTLGVEVRLREPRFYPLHVTAWVLPGPGTDFEETRGTLLKALERFLHPVSGNFHAGGWPFGRLPTTLELRSRLQSAAPGAALMELSAAVTTPEGREAEVAAVDDPFALPVNGNHAIYELKKPPGQTARGRGRGPD